MASALLTAAAACTKPDPTQIAQDMTIYLAASESGATKALLNEAAFAKTGNRIKIYDYYTATDGTTQWYIDDHVKADADGASIWPFETKKYSWTADGVHKFFGWLAEDISSGSALTPAALFGSSFIVNADGEIPAFSKDDLMLTIPSTSMTVSTTQFDFMYSDIHERNLTANPDYATPVPLSFSHLFTAFSIGATNTSDQNVTIKAFTLENLKNKNSASINWSAMAPIVSYGTSEVDGTPFRSLTQAYDLNSGSKVGNIFTGGVQEFILLWPQAASDVHSTAEITDDMLSGITEYPSDYRMSVTYTVTENDGAVSSEITKRLNFPNMAWEAGKKYHFEVLFADKMVELKTIVKPWKHEPQEMDFSDAMVTVKENHWLVWDENTAAIDVTNKYAYIRDGQPIKGSFTIDTPQGGTWLVSLTGDIDAFEVSPSSGLIDGTTATVSIKPLVADPQRDYSVNVKFAVRRPDGRVIAADDVLQPADSKYTIVLSSN